MQSATHTRPAPGSLRLARLRARWPASWGAIAVALLCAGAVIGFFAFPTYPTYDSFYALLWGRDLLHLHLPDFRVYRAPTEHPLAIAFGMLCSISGQAGGRVMVLGSILSFVAAVVGMYRLGRLCFGPVVGVLAALLVLTRFYVENLAAQGYLDVSYVALLVWAIVLEIERPRRGPVVLLLLAAAGLLRPDAWALSGVYWLWCVWPSGAQAERVAGASAGSRAADGPGRDERSRLARVLSEGRTYRYLALAIVAPVIWVATDAVVTGDPLYSLHSTSGLAQELERTQGLTSVLASTWTYSVRIDKLPVVLGVLAGIPLAVWLAPRRAIVPLTALLVLTRFYVENLAAQGYLDVSYVALLVWAIVLEVQRPRRGTVVFLLLAAAGLLRPDAWALSGAYWLW
ncbi:MAG TPA: glycosyltransferase family 39 protein, partial [Solirubrobacteraceae bacterium]|nr:glycosyltransferase family 39 protein [Solirubrobacteraceae bacterium]